MDQRKIPASRRPQDLARVIEHTHSQIPELAIEAGFGDKVIRGCERKSIVVDRVWA